MAQAWSVTLQRHPSMLGAKELIANGDHLPAKRGAQIDVDAQDLPDSLAVAELWWRRLMEEALASLDQLGGLGEVTPIRGLELLAGNLKQAVVNAQIHCA